MRRLASLALPVALLALAAPVVALPGGYTGGEPTPPKGDEVAKAAAELIIQVEDATTSLDGFAKITYKALLVSQDELQKKLVEKFKDRYPKNKDVAAAMKDFASQVQDAVAKALAEPDD